MSYDYYKSIRLDALNKQEYDDLKEAGVLNTIYPEACGVYEDDVVAKRIDIIGQNGNDGEHYDDVDYRLPMSDNPDGISWPHQRGDSYADKVSTVVIDEVEAPTHYELFPDMEAIEAIRKVLSPIEYQGYLKGNILKYRMRAGKKDDILKDIAKANMYDKFLGEI